MAPDEQGLIGNWSPGIGDPTVIGWVATILYIVVTVVCVLNAQRSGRGGQGVSNERGLWRVMALVYGPLGVNKQLDLQSALIESARILSHMEGWYPYRHAVQRAFVVGLGAAAFAGILLLGFLVRGATRNARVATAGMVLVLVFVVARAALFSHVAYRLRNTPLGPRWSWLLELAGISITLVFGALRLRDLRPGQRRGARS